MVLYVDLILTLFTFLSPDVVPGRIRLNSESHASTASRDEGLQVRGEEEAGTPTEGAPFRGRSKSAPPALWAAKKYGQKLRRMSDEFDSLLDKGVRMRGQWGSDQGKGSGFVTMFC